MLSHRDEIKRTAAARGRRGGVRHGASKGQSHRHQGHRAPPANLVQVDGPARCRPSAKARRRSCRPRPAPVGDPQGRRRQAIADPSRPEGRRESRVPRCRSARASRRRPKRRQPRWSAKRSRAADVASLNTFVAQKNTSRRSASWQLREPEVLIVPMEATAVARFARRHRRESAKATFRWRRRRRRGTQDRVADTRASDQPGAFRRRLYGLRPEAGSVMIIEYLVSLGRLETGLLPPGFLHHRAARAGRFHALARLSALLGRIISAFRLRPWQYQLVASRCSRWLSDPGDGHAPGKSAISVSHLPGDVRSSAIGRGFGRL